jgi:lipoprotein-anchoring transpeptidase ErfK/SrfK
MPAVTQRGRAALLPVLAVLLALLLAVASPGRAGTATGTRSQEVALLLATHVARVAPDDRAHALELIRALRPLTAERTALPVVAHRTDAHGAKWLRVLLPGRPNGHAGWIKQAATTAAATPWRIVVHTATRRVTVFLSGRVFRSFIAIVGKASTPTPHGAFFIEESIKLRAGDVGAPYALALSARSTVLQEFDGGPGQIALHGLMNVGGVLGTAASHGCVRLDNDAMRWLVGRIGPGVPVTITS